MKFCETVSNNEPYRLPLWIHHPLPCILGHHLYFGQWLKLHIIASIFLPPHNYPIVNCMSMYRYWISSGLFLCHCKCRMFCYHWMVDSKGSISETKGGRRWWYPTWRWYTFVDGSRRTTFLRIELFCFICIKRIPIAHNLTPSSVIIWYVVKAEHPADRIIGGACMHKGTMCNVSRAPPKLPKCVKHPRE